MRPSGAREDASGRLSVRPCEERHHDLQGPRKTPEEAYQNSGTLRARRRSSKLLCLGGAELNNLAYNLLLDARAKRQDRKSAEDIMDQTRQAGMTDVVSFNILIKAHL